MSEIPYCANCSECRDDAGKDRAGVPDKKLCYPHALEIANGWRDGFASLRAENERLAGALHSLARIETDEEGLPVLVISCGFHCQTSDQAELPLVWAALSRPAARGGE